jgi:hypothetical protein
MAGITAFREAYVSAGSATEAAFESWEGRQARYAILWAMFENTAYRKIHSWSTSLKKEYGLYKYIRNIYNPANRDGIFWQTHLLGGALDPAAGDGKSVPSALPILTDNDALRMAIAQTWKNSNFLARKDIVSLWGAVMGDVGLRVIDDPDRAQVYVQPVNPSTLADVTFDAFGNVKGYILEEMREDPRANAGQAQRPVTYTEIATRNGDEVEYETQLDGKPYAWNGDVALWSEPYGFVPLVFIKHFDIGLEWGWSELQAVLSKVREVDDQASKISDQIRKLVDAPWLFSGVDKPKGTVKTAGADPALDRPEPGREEIPALYGPLGASATPLVAPLDLTAALSHVESLLAELERDLPELQHDIWSVGTDPSGKALRVARQRVEAKVQMRRINYDDGIRRALQMAISIGGFRNYDGFTGFDLDSYKAGNLEFSIGERPVFKSDPLDHIEEEAAFWTAARTATQTGMPLDLFLKRANWADDDIQAVVSSDYYKGWVAAQGGLP